MRGDSGRRPETLLYRQRIGVDVHVDVQLLHHQPRGEAADEVRLCSDCLPAFDQLRFGDYLPAPSLIGFGHLSVIFHCRCFLRGAKIWKIGEKGPFGSCPM